MAAQVPAVPPRDLIEVLERVLTKGVIFEIDEDVEASATDRDAAAWFRISIAGVDVFKVGGRVAWRYFLEPGLDKKEQSVFRAL